MSNQDQIVTIARDVSSVVAGQQLAEATSQIQYVSSGHALVIGELSKALHAVSALSANGVTIVEIQSDSEKVQKRLTDDGVAVFTVPELKLSGYLGAFKAIVPPSDAQSTAFDLAVSVYLQSGCFDVVLDLSDEPYMPHFLPPFGYRHVTDAAQISDAADDLKEMHGEFEKPRYFNYNAGICAHSRSNLAGCTRCIDVCATGAIVSKGEGVSVDPFLCQGCGSCATVCPSGAMSYAYPRASNAIDRARTAMESEDACVLLLYSESHEATINTLDLHTDILPLQVEEVSAFGADFWLALLAGSACRIVLLSDADDKDPSRQAIVGQIALVRELLLGLGVDEPAVVLVESGQLSNLAADSAIAPDSDATSLNALIPQSWRGSLLNTGKPADFATHDDKRQTIRLALDSLSEQLPPLHEIASLAKGAPFGRINVDQQACTLCMACVSTCPAKALLDGQDTPALRFVEANCLQCGLCETACPESAISLQAQYTWDSVNARQIKTLHEEEPFHCIVCHTPFATRAMIDTMGGKLSSHWMFQDEKALRRLKMCGDCRVRDMFETDSQGIDVHKPD